MEYIESKYFSYADPDDPWYRKLIIRSIESMAGQPALFKLYREYQENPNNWDSFWHGCLDQLNLNLDYNSKIEVPRNGPTIFVANHPYGVLDGLVISYFVSKFRDDFKVLTHSFRYGMIGISDISVDYAILMICLFILIFSIFVYVLLKRGIGIRT